MSPQVRSARRELSGGSRISHGGAFADRLRQAGIAVEIENGLTKMAPAEDALALLRLAGRFPGVVRRLRRIIRTFDADSSSVMPSVRL
jgi:hypothetical protein